MIERILLCLAIGALVALIDWYVTTRSAESNGYDAEDEGWTL